MRIYSHPSQDSTRSVDLVNLDGRIESFNEWYEGFEELEAIPHSFAIKFVDGSIWLLYADTEQDKARSTCTWRRRSVSLAYTGQVAHSPQRGRGRYLVKI